MKTALAKTTTALAALRQRVQAVARRGSPPPREGKKTDGG